MDIISSNPRSFKLDWESSQASKLKQAVVEKLFEFLGNDTANVLAEYIVEHVCNGKSLNEARDYLEAFLGYQSRKFVSWLWGHLLKSVIHSGSSNLKEASSNDFYGDIKDKDKRTIGSMIHLNHSTGVSGSHMGLEEGFQCWCPAKEGRPKHRSLAPQNSTYDGNNGALGQKSSRSQNSSTISDSTEQSLLYGDRNMMVISDNCLLSDSLHYSPKRKLIPRSLQPGTEKPLSRLLPVTSGTSLRLSSRAPHDVPDPFVRPRRSVWDRLGKRIEKDTVMTDDKIRLEEPNTMKKKQQHHGGPSNHGFKKIIMPDDWLQSRFLTESPQLNDSSGRATNDPGICNISKKRHFRGSRIQNRVVVASDSNVVNAKDEQTVLGIQRSPSFNQCVTQNLKGDVLEHRSMVAHLSGPSNESLDYPHSKFNCRGHVVDQVHAHKKAQLSIPEAPFTSNNPSLSQMERFSNAACIHINLLEADLLNVKLRLDQIENEIRKLRAMQMETKEYVELGVPLYSGIENRSDEDLESRTVLVTNVHCNATKKALMSHFSECGAVVNATMLSDRGSDQPKGSAYVVFSCKEMADKAVAMSGTSFFSRTLKIVHKATMQKASLPLLQPAVESPLSGPPAKRKAIIPKKREPSTNADSSEPANAGSSQPQKPVQNEVGVESTVEAP